MPPGALSNITKKNRFVNPSALSVTVDEPPSTNNERRDASHHSFLKQSFFGWLRDRGNKNHDEKDFGTGVEGFTIDHINQPVGPGSTHPHYTGQLHWLDKLPVNTYKLYRTQKGMHYNYENNIEIRTELIYRDDLPRIDVPNGSGWFWL